MFLFVCLFVSFWQKNSLTNSYWCFSYLAFFEEKGGGGSQQCGPGLSWTHCVGQIGFKLTVLQTHPSECWDWPQGSATMPSTHYFVHLFFKIKCIRITFFPVCNFFILSAYIFDSLTESRIFFGNFISFVFLHLRDMKAFWFSVLSNLFFFHLPFLWILSDVLELIFWGHLVAFSYLATHLFHLYSFSWLNYWWFSTLFCVFLLECLLRGCFFYFYF